MWNQDAEARKTSQMAQNTLNKNNTFVFFVWSFERGNLLFDQRTSEQKEHGLHQSYCRLGGFVHPQSGSEGIKTFLDVYPPHDEEIKDPIIDITRHHSGQRNIISMIVSDRFGFVDACSKWFLPHHDLIRPTLEVHLSWYQQETNVSVWSEVAEEKYTRISASLKSLGIIAKATNPPL